MAEAIFCGLAAALVFMGVLAVFYLLVLRFFKPQGNACYILTLPTDARADEISTLICGANIRNMIFGDLLSDGVIVLDMGLDDERRVFIRELTSEYGGVEILTLDELVTVINGGRKE